jgi:hypothetical protein
LYYTTSTFGSAAQNLLPMLTFAMATFLRLEQVNIRSLGGQAKVIGTVISVGGAMIMTLYKGPVLKFLSPGVEGHLMTSNSKPKNLVLGSILVFVSIVTWSASIVFQAPVLKRYPAQLSLTTFACLFGSLQSGLIAVIWERKKINIWAIGWNSKLLGVVYSGIMGSALGMYVQAWCISKKGPVFVAKKILELKAGTEVLAYVSQVHKEVLPDGIVDHDTLTQAEVESNIVRCPDPVYAEKMIAAIDDVRIKGDSVGGVVTCIVRNVPRGLGAPVFDKLEAELAKALMSLPATKGFEIGSGFAGTLITGSEHIMINSHPDTDDAAAYENPDEEAVAMIEESPTTVAMLSSPAADDCGHGSSSRSMDCSTIVKVRTIHISSAILAAKSPFFYKLFSN